MYYRSGEIYFSGFLLEGYRNGPGVEYRKDGSVIYEGFYKNGRRAPNIKQRSDGSNYWDEKNKYGEMVSMFQIDDIGLYHGICYIYFNGEISKISRWEHGKEMEILKKFDGLTMQMYENGKETFSGRYYRKSVFEYVPIYPTEIETKSDSKKSKKKKKDCECTYDCFKDYLLMFFMWILIIALVGIVLGLILITLFMHSEPLAILGWVMLYMAFFCLSLLPVLFIIWCNAVYFHECNCF